MAGHNPTVFRKYLFAILLSITTLSVYADYPCIGNKQEQEFIRRDVTYTSVLCWNKLANASNVQLSVSLYRDDLLVVAQTWVDIEPEGDVDISFSSGEEYLLGEDVLTIPVYINEILRGGTFKEEWTQLWLFTFNGNELRRVLSEFVVASSYSRGCVEDCGDNSRSTEIEVSSDSFSHGLQDLILHKTSIDYDKDGNEEIETESARYVFSGKQYEPEN
jgi:hypothetical protein